MNTIPSAKECACHGVKKTIEYFVSMYGVGFHPDNDFGDYLPTERQPNNKKIAKVHNQMLTECFDMCDKYELDIYEISLEIMQPLINQLCVS